LQAAESAACRALPRAGNNMAAKAAIIAMTTKSSISVKPLVGCLEPKRLSGRTKPLRVTQEFM
jgi:hypothetical protein